MDEDEKSELCPICSSSLEYIPWLGELMCPNCDEAIDLDAFDD